MHRVHREGLDGTGDGNEAWRTTQRRKRPCVRPATFETGSCSSRGVWRSAKRRKQTSYGRNGGPVDREGCGVPQNGRNGPPTVETGGPVDQEGCGVPQNGRNGPPMVETGVLFIQPPPRATPPATVQPPLHGHPSTVYCSSIPPLHGALFIQPQPARSRQRHHSLFIPPPATLTVHPIDRI